MAGGWRLWIGWEGMRKREEKTGARDLSALFTCHKARAVRVAHARTRVHKHTHTHTVAQTNHVCLHYKFLFFFFFFHHFARTEVKHGLGKAPLKS